MNGDSRETGKLTPEGKPDPSVFSSDYNREGIRVGTAISLMVRQTRRSEKPGVSFRQFWGITKRQDLLDSIKSNDLDAQYQLSNPVRSNRFSFIPININSAYSNWPQITDLCAIYPFNGPIERRGNSLIVFEEDKVSLQLLKAYLDPGKSDDEIRSLAPRFMKSSGEFKAEKTRAMLKGRVVYNANNISRYPFKPFDKRLAYLDSQLQPLFSRPSPELLALKGFSQNAFFITRDTADKVPEGSPFFFSRLICDYDCISGHARHFPFRIPMAKKNKIDAQQKNLFEDIDNLDEALIANISSSTRSYLIALNIIDIDSDPYITGLIWMHALAIGYSPAYLSENADGIRQDWPRIPLPDQKDVLLHSAELGHHVAQLLDTERMVSGVSGGKIRPELRPIAVVTGADNRQLNPENGDLAITAGWGHNGKEGVTMPGKGKVVKRDYTAQELEAIREGAEALGLTLEQALQHVGEATCDVYLNNIACWKNVPDNVWNYHIGGYQVIKKWLSYREQGLLGRALSVEEVREVTAMARRIAAILLLEPELDKNYLTVKQSTYAWPTSETVSL